MCRKTVVKEGGQTQITGETNQNVGIVSQEEMESVVVRAYGFGLSDSIGYDNNVINHNV